MNAPAKCITLQTIVHFLVFLTLKRYCFTRFAHEAVSCIITKERQRIAWFLCVFKEKRLKIRYNDGLAEIFISEDI
jgi:hypothetical protein